MRNPTRVLPRCRAHRETGFKATSPPGECRDCVQYLPHHVIPGKGHPRAPPLALRVNLARLSSPEEQEDGGPARRDDPHLQVRKVSLVFVFVFVFSLPLL